MHIIDLVCLMYFTVLDINYCTKKVEASLHVMTIKISVTVDLATPVVSGGNAYNVF